MNFGANSFSLASVPDGSIAPMAGTEKSLSTWARMWLTGHEGMGSDPETLCRPQEQSSWVMAAIDLVVKQITPLPLVWTANAESREALPADGDRAKFWTAPGRTRAGALRLCDIVELAGAWVKLRGVCHFILDDTWLQSRSVARSPFLIARPDRMRPVEDGGPGGEVVGWLWTDARGQRHQLIPEQVVTIRQVNIFDDIGGLSSYSAASMAAEADAAAGRFAKNIAASNGQRGEYIIAEGGSPTDAQREQIVASLREKKRRARNGDFAPVFLSGGLRVEDAKISSVDAAFVSQRIENRHEIFAAFGVPMSFADVKAAYSIGADSDARQLVQGASMPLAEKLSAAFAEIETRRTGRAIHADFGWSQHPVMQQVFMGKLDAASKLADRGVPMVEINRVLDLGLPRFLGDDVGFLPFGVQPMTDALGLDEQTATPPETQPAEAVQNGFAALAGVLKKALEEKRAKALAIEAGTKGTQATKGTKDGMPVIQMGARSRANLWNKHQAKRAPFERKMGASLRKVLGAARAKVLAAVERMTAPTNAGGYNYGLSLSDLQDGMWKAVKPVLQATMNKAGSDLMDEVGSDDAFTMAPQVAKNFLDVRENRIKDASTEIFNSITQTLKDGFDAGETTQQLTDRVKQEFAGISKRRAETIATTETSAAYGVARHAAMEQAGVTYKEWLTARDDRVRAEHAEMDGTIVPIDEPFVMGDGAELMHPAEEGGPPEHVINCRCVAIAALKSEGGDE